MSQPDFSSADAVRTALAQVFDKAQTHKRAHSKLCSALLKVRRATLSQGSVCFFEAFVTNVHRLLVVKTREPSVERCVEFVIAFANACAREQAILGRSDESGVEENNALSSGSTGSSAAPNAADDEFFTSQLVVHLLQFHNAKDSAVRFRVCQLVAAVFNNLDEDAEIDDDLWDDVVDAMVMRCKDKIVTVRVEAARCLRRLHEPDDLESTATAELLALMHTDKSKEVRRVALMSSASTSALCRT